MTIIINYYHVHSLPNSFIINSKNTFLHHNGFSSEGYQLAIPRRTMRPRKRWLWEICTTWTYKTIFVVRLRKDACNGNATIINRLIDWLNGEKLSFNTCNTIEVYVCDVVCQLRTTWRVQIWASDGNLSSGTADFSISAAKTFRSNQVKEQFACYFVQSGQHGITAK